MIEIRRVPITDNIIYRSSQPDSVGDFDTIRALGIKTVLDLNDDSAHLVNEKLILDKRGVKHIWYPLSEIFPPRTKQLRRCVEIICKAEHPILVHCKHGVDRTGYVIAAYRMLHPGCFYGFSGRHTRKPLRAGINGGHIRIGYQH